MSTYVQPQVQVFQEFRQLPVNVVANQNGFVFGPNYKLFRYAQASEKALIGLGDYDPTTPTAYAYPEQPAGSSVDLSYVKLVMDDVLAQYAAIASGATAPLVAVSNTERNKLRAMPSIEDVELQAVLDVGVTAQMGGYFNGGPNLPEAMYFWPTGGAKADMFSVLGTDTAVLNYRAGTAGNTGSMAVPANALVSGVEVEGPFGMVFDFDSPAAATRVAGIITFTGKPANGNAITIDGTTYTFKTVYANPDDIVIGTTAQDCYQALRYAVESAASVRLTSACIVPGATTAAGAMYIFGVTPLAVVGSTLDNATVTAVATCNSLRQPVVLKFAVRTQDAYFTFQVDPLLLATAVDYGVDENTPVTVKVLQGSATAVAWDEATATLTVTLASTTVAELRAALVADSDVAALFSIGELIGDGTALVSAAFDEAGFYFADTYGIVMVPDALRVKVLPNDVTFVTGNGFTASAAQFKTRGVRVGDRLRYSVVGTDSAVYTGITKVAGYEADTLASVIGAPSVASTNGATQAGTDLEALSTALPLAAGADNQRSFEGYVQALDTAVFFFPGSYSAGVISDNYTVTITTGGVAGEAYATVTAASGMYTRTNVPIVASGATIGAIYLGSNMYMFFTQGVESDAIFQAGDTYEFSADAAAPFTAVAASKLAVTGTYTGARDTTYRLEVTRGGVFDRVVNVIPGLEDSGNGTLSLVVDWDSWLPGDVDDEYILVCTKAGSITTAQFTLSSQLGDNVTTLKFAGSGIGSTRTFGAQGLECHMTASGNFVVGDSWVVRVNASRPQVRITDSAGLDQNKVLTAADGTSFDVGLYGVSAEFQTNTDTLGGFAPNGGLLLGDVFYIEAAAESAGPIKTLVLADDLPELVTTGLTVDNSGAVPVSTANYAPTPFSSWYYLVQASTEISSEKTQSAPDYNWEAAVDAITVNDAIQVQDGSWTDPDGSLPYLNVYTGSMFVEYRALLTDYADAIYSLTDINDVVTELGTVHPDNPLAQGVYNALLNSGSQPVYFMAVPTDDPAGYAVVLSQASKTNSVYGFAPLSCDSVIQDAVEAHIAAMSTETGKKWRIGAFGLNMVSEVAKVNSATYPTPGTDWTATVTNNQAGSGNTLVTFTNGSPGLIANVSAGDVVRCNFQTDAWGSATYETYTVASIKSNTQLVLSSGPSSPISVAGKTEVWHTYSTAQLATAVAAASTHYASRRVVAVFPWVAYTGGVAQTAEFIAAAVVGLISSVPPQQGLTNIELTGFDDLPLVYSTFSNEQLNEMAAGGTFIVMQDMAGSAVYVRHQVTSATPDGNLLTTELSVTKNLDAISYYFAGVLSPFVGKYNITDELLTVIETQIQDGLNYLGSARTSSGLLGPMVILGTNTKITAVEQHPTLRDHIYASVDLELPLPANVIQLHLVV